MKEHVLSAIGLLAAVFVGMWGALNNLPDPWGAIIALALAPVLGLLWDAGMTGRPFTLLSAPGGFWANLYNEVRISTIRLGEMSLLGFRPGVLWGQVGAVGGGMVIDESFRANADLSGQQYRFMVVATGGNRVDVATGATNIGVGILQNKPTSGQTAWVRLFGKTKFNSDAALTVGLLVGPAADGQADSKVAGTDTTEYNSGIITKASGAAGEMAEGIIGFCAGRGA